jgi:hypothetical protein
MADDELLDAWIESLCAELGLPEEAAGLRAVLLDLARDAAHNVMRPAAPLTTFLVGLAAGRAAAAGADLSTAVTAAAAKATTLTEQFSQSD